MEELNEEQIKELNEIGRLPQQEQSERLQEFLSTLTEEQIEWLKSQQANAGTGGGQCPFCLMGEGKIETKVVFSDESVMAVLDINPASDGHTIAFLKEHHGNLFDIPFDKFEYLMKACSLIGAGLVKVLNADGFNLFIANGKMAGQRVDHILIHLIPRFNGDGVNFNWKAKKIDEDKASKVLESFKNFQVPASKMVEEKIIPEEVEYEEFERIP
ncbi:MAG TPA: HIT family protein [Candidatus Nanoarchaeia archaeon]|nr:HIT family protein [Candidatus Nanoarchaeia archaeon]